jgi:3-oxoacyl-[acyl-carrier protein] reductase
MELKNRTAVITGAASGMGMETALLFAKNGYDIVGIDVDEDNLEKTVSKIKRGGGNAYGVATDITDIKAVKDMAKTVRKKSGKINVLINAAGVLGGFVNLVDFGEKTLDLILDVNLKGTYWCCKYLIPLLEKHNNSIIINISSQSGKIGQAGVAVYAAAKWGVIGFTKSLDLELRKDGIKVAVINPGSTNSPFHDKREVKLPEGLLNKFLDPSDIARACLYMAEQPVNCFAKELDIIPMSETLEVKIE